MNARYAQAGRIDAAALRDRIAQDERWFAERHTELRQMRDIFRGDD
jgi:hypothetical protein